MRTALHLALWDARRVWMPAALWMTVHLGWTMTAELTAWTTAPAAPSSTLAPATLLYVADLFLVWVLTALIVQADPPIGRSPFWRTRPISPLTLMGAKLLALILVLMVVPVAFNGVRLFTYGASAASVAAASVQLAISSLAWIFPAWILAALTATFTRFILAVLMLPIALYVYLSLLFLVLFGGGDVDIGPAGFGVSFHPDVASYGIVGFAAVLLVAITAVYLIRNRVIGGALAFAVFLIPVENPGVPTGPLTDGPAASRVAEVVGSRVVLERARLRMGASSVGDGARLEAQVALPAVDLPYTAHIEPRQATLRQSGGSELIVQSIEPGRMSEEYARTVAAGIRPCEPSSDLPSDPRRARPVFHLSRSGADALAGSPVMLTGTATVSLARHERVAVLPLSARVAYRTPEYLLEIMRMERSTAGLFLIGRLTRFPTFPHSAAPHLHLFARAAGATRGTPLRLDPVSGLDLSLVHWYTAHTDRGPRPWGSNIQRIFRGSIGPGMADPLTACHQVDWRAAAELVVVESTYVGRTDLPWRANDVVVEASPD